MVAPMVKKQKVTRPRRKSHGTGRVMRPISFTFHPETIERLKVTLEGTEGSTSAFVENAVLRALNELPAEGAETPKMGPGSPA